MNFISYLIYITVNLEPQTISFILRNIKGIKMGMWRQSVSIKGYIKKYKGKTGVNSGVMRKRS